MQQGVQTCLHGALRSLTDSTGIVSMQTGEVKTSYVKLNLSFHSKNKFKLFQKKIQELHQLLHRIFCNLREHCLTEPDLNNYR